MRWAMVVGRRGLERAAPGLESVVMAALALWVGHWRAPDDPLSLRGPFAWAVLPVLLAGLRYGALGAFTATGVFAAAAALGWRSGAPGLESFPVELIVGLLVVATVCGEFSDGWRRKLSAAESERARATHRLAVFARTYHLLRASHQELEERSVDAPPSLRELLTELARCASSATRSARPLEDVGERVLDLFAQAGRIQLASLLLASGDGLEPKPIASLGQVEVNPNDPLLREALKTRTVVAVRPGEREQSPSLLLVAIPLVDVRGTLYGMVAVQEMAFVALNEQTLRLFATLGAHVGDLLAHAPGVVEPSHRSAVLEELRLELARARRDRAPAALLRLSVASGNASPALAALRASLRCLDRIFACRGMEQTTLVAWLPFTPGEAVEQVATRVQEAVTRATGAEVVVARLAFGPGDLGRDGEERLREELGMGVGGQRVAVGSVVGARAR